MKIRYAITYWRHYKAKDFILFCIGLFIEIINKRIPKSLLTRKKIVDFILAGRGHFITRKNEIEIGLEGEKYVLRRTGSDMKLFYELVIRGGFKRVIELMNKLNTKDIHVLDCGANVGLTTILIKKNFPNAKIVSLEPESGNYNQLVKNITINGYENIIPLHMGVWFEKTQLSPNTNFRDGQNWSFALTPPNNNNGSISVDTPKSFMHNQNWPQIDVLKIDVEGSEFPLFRNSASWEEILHSVKVISIEVHEDVGSLFEIAEILWRKGFTLERNGELLIGVKGL